MRGLLFRGPIKNSLAGRAFWGEGGNDPKWSDLGGSHEWCRGHGGAPGPSGKRETRKGECFKQGVEVWRHSFPHSFVLASPGFGVSTYLQCGIQGKRVGLSWDPSDSCSALRVIIGISLVIWKKISYKIHMCLTFWRVYSFSHAELWSFGLNGRHWTMTRSFCILHHPL